MQRFFVRRTLKMEWDIPNGIEVAHVLILEYLSSNSRMASSGTNTCRSDTLSIVNIIVNPVLNNCRRTQAIFWLWYLMSFFIQLWRCLAVFPDASYFRHISANSRNIGLFARTKQIGKFRWAAHLEFQFMKLLPFPVTSVMWSYGMTILYNYRKLCTWEKLWVHRAF